MHHFDGLDRSLATLKTRFVRLLTLKICNVGIPRPSPYLAKSPCECRQI